MSILSILTPSFNYDWCIEDALRSVTLAAKFMPEHYRVEHVVVDGGSTDQSGEILERWRDNLILERRNESHGQSSNLNRGLSLARGEWIGWLNADDFYLPGSLRDACTAFDDDVDIIYGDVALVNESGQFIRLMAEHPFSLWTLRWWGTYLPVGAVFMRKSLVSQLGWREDLTLLLDWDLWLRSAEAGARFKYISRPLVAVRRHAGQESRQDRPDRLHEKARVRRDHGLPSRPWMWRACQRVAAFGHGGLKLVSGGYSKQRRAAAALHDRPMRWFNDRRGQSSVQSLYEVVYQDTYTRMFLG